jgi:hypothetical protein
MELQRLIEFIRSHDTEAYANADGTISALEKFTRNGVYGEEWIRLPARLSAVRDWLGY